MNGSELQKEIDKLDVVIQELRQDLDGAIRLRQVWKDRLAEAVSPYFEVDANHWDDVPLAGDQPLAESQSCGVVCMMSLVESLWTAEQVETLNRLQRGELYGHPYTCPHRGEVPHYDNGHDTGCLLATKDGWVCPDCGYTQDWAHASSLEAMSLADMMRLLSQREKGACP